MSDAVRKPWACWLLLGLAFGMLEMGRERLPHLNMPDPRLPIRDFFQEWASAKNYFTGRPIYTHHDLTLPAYLGITRNVPRHYYAEVNAHPPPSVLLALPLARLDYINAFAVWNILSLAALALSVWLIARHAGIVWSPPALLTFGLLLLLSYPIQEHLFHAQWTLPILLLVTGAWVAERSGRPATAGLLLGLATAVKIFPAFLFLYFLARRQWRAVGAGLACGLAMTLLTVAVLGPDTYRDYVRDALSQIGAWRSAAENHSLHGWWWKLFHWGGKGGFVTPLAEKPLWAAVGGLATCAALAVLLAWLAARARSRGERDRAFGLMVTGMVLASPVAWSHYFPLLLLPLALTWQRLATPAGRGAVALVVGVVFWSPMFWYERLGLTLIKPAVWEWGPHGPWQSVGVFSLSLYAVLGLLGLGVWGCRDAAVKEVRLAEPAVSQAA